MCLLLACCKKGVATPCTLKRIIKLYWFHQLGDPRPKANSATRVTAFLLQCTYTGEKRTLYHSSNVSHMSRQLLVDSSPSSVIPKPHHRRCRGAPPTQRVSPVGIISPLFACPLDLERSHATHTLEVQVVEGWGGIDSPSHCATDPWKVLQERRSHKHNNGSILLQHPAIASSSNPQRISPTPNHLGSAGAILSLCTKQLHPEISAGPPPFVPFCRQIPEIAGGLWYCRFLVFMGCARIIPGKWHPSVPANACCLFQGKITTMIDYARMLKGPIPLISNGFFVPELVSDLVDMMAPNAEIQGVEILVIPDPSTPHKLMGDSTRLLEILCILMDNAIRYSPSSGTVWFRIWHSDMAMGSCMMHFEIQDEGPGMDESALRSAHNRHPLGNPPLPAFSFLFYWCSTVTPPPPATTTTTTGSQQHLALFRQYLRHLAVPLLVWQCEISLPVLCLCYKTASRLRHGAPAADLQRLLDQTLPTKRYRSAEIFNSVGKMCSYTKKYSKDKLIFQGQALETVKGCTKLRKD